MPRQSITLTEPNDDWLTSQVASREYTSKSEVVNHLIRKARDIDLIRAKLIAAELSAERNDWVEKSAAELLDDFHAKARRDGTL